MTEIDLETGSGESSRRRERRSSSASTGVGNETKTESNKIDRELHSRCVEAFGQVQEWRESREDTELADAIGEDKEKMSKGLVSVTHVIPWLRQPLLILLAFAEPVLAFGRIGRILAARWFTRRQRRAEKIAAAQAEWDAEHGATPVVVP